MSIPHQAQDILGWVVRTRHKVKGHRSQVRVTGHMSGVTGQGSQVRGHWSGVTGQGSLVRGHKSGVTGHRSGSQVRRHRSVGTGQARCQCKGPGSGLKGQK